MAGFKYLIQLMGGLYHSVISIHIHVTIHFARLKRSPFDMAKSGKGCLCNALWA